MFSLYLTTGRYLIWQPNMAHFLLSGNIKLQSDNKATGEMINWFNQQSQSCWPKANHHCFCFNNLFWH